MEPQKYEEPLTPAEKTRLEDYEAVISAKLKAFYDVGMALAEIRDSRLYREQYSTFEEYCRERWDMGRRHINRLIGSARVVENLGPIGPKPLIESQARPLTKLAPQLQVEAWQRAVETAPEGKVTARHVKSVVDEIIDMKPKNQEGGVTDQEIAANSLKRSYRSFLQELETAKADGWANISFDYAASLIGNLNNFIGGYNYDTI